MKFSQISWPCKDQISYNMIRPKRTKAIQYLLPNNSSSNHDRLKSKWKKRQNMEPITYCPHQMIRQFGGHWHSSYKDAHVHMWVWRGGTDPVPPSFPQGTLDVYSHTGMKMSRVQARGEDRSTQTATTQDLLNDLWVAYKHCLQDKLTAWRKRPRKALLATPEKSVSFRQPPRQMRASWAERTWRTRAQMPGWTGYVQRTVRKAVSASAWIKASRRTSSTESSRFLSIQMVHFAPSWALTTFHPLYCDSYLNLASIT